MIFMDMGFTSGPIKEFTLAIGSSIKCMGKVK
jgi:hypothetical protein